MVRSKLTKNHSGVRILTEPKTLLILGDSNTHCTKPLTFLSDRERHPYAIRWPTLLARKLGQKWRVIDEGLPGRTTVHNDPVEGAHKNGASVLPAILGTHRPIDGIVVMLGTNDLKPRFAVTAFDIAQSIGRLLQIIRASGCGPKGAPPKVMVISPPPIKEIGVLAEMFKNGRAISLTLGKEIEEMALRENVFFVDLGKHVNVSEVDGVHYDAGSMKPIASLVADCVKKLSW